MSADGSMAVWCVYRQDCNDATAEVHFNYWRIAQKAGFFSRTQAVEDFAEIGILVTDPMQIEKICLFLPYPVTLAAIKDCGPYFKKVVLAQGIFNEPLTCTSVGPPGPYRVELLKDGKPFCRIHQFAMTGDQIDGGQMIVRSEAGGSVITITRQAINEIATGLSEKCPAYFRLRTMLSPDDRRCFIQVTSPPDHWLRSGYDEIECFDFRLNEARTLPEQIERLMRDDEHQVPLTRIAFLTAIPVVAELAGTSIATHKNRVLEHDLWNTYVPAGLPTNMMVYHWREEDDGGISDFSAFVKLRIRRSNFGTLATYLLIAFIFAVVGSLTASRIDRWWWAPTPSETHINTLSKGPITVPEKKGK